MNKILRLNTRDKSTLLRSSFIAQMGPTVVPAVLELVTIVNVDARDVLFREGDHAEAFYSVLAGYMRLYRLNKDGREADIRICGPGDTFAECLLALGNTYLYNAQAAEPVTLARFDLQRMRQIADKNPEVSRAIICCLSDHLLVSMDCIANDRLQTAPQRVAHYLLTTVKTEQGAASIRLPFQKSLLAGKLGLAPEALSRAFSSLRRVGVQVRGRTIQISDVNALRDI